MRLFLLPVMLLVVNACVSNGAEILECSWNVNGLERQATVYLPTKSGASPAPVVFAFHGHGGNSRHSARSFAIHTHWPEAIVIYPQGIPTPGMLTDPEGRRNGWQHAAGAEDDRDLKFVDAMLKTLFVKSSLDSDETTSAGTRELRKALQRQPADSQRVFATGHSNGGGFTYLLWATRADQFAAFAPSAAAGRKSVPSVPRPAMHIGGRNDQLVRFAWQERQIDAVKKINRSSPDGREWAKDCTLFSSTTGAPFVAMIHDGTHKYPSEAPALIVKFFKEFGQPTPTD
ncbi:MAG: hypothetical protein KDA81_09640 [Planctomycetaceae bacterium]|nr:hypothetical protein [Planctomycetaceae bacterium]